MFILNIDANKYTKYFQLTYATDYLMLTNIIFTI